MTQSQHDTRWPEVNSDADLHRVQHHDPDYTPTEAEARPPVTAPGTNKTGTTTQKPPMDEMQHVKWGITWRLPTLVLCSYLASILTALGHHFFYLGFESTPVQSVGQQTWAIRIGTGLAFLNKTLMIAIMSMIGTQQIWVTLRRKCMTINGIDSMFQIMSDPTAIFSSQLWTRAKTLLLLAVTSWAIPLVAVVTPATLSVRSSMGFDVVSTMVPTTNFANLTGWATYEGLGRIDSASFEMSRIFSAVASSISFIPLEAPFANSTYDLSFWGPSYKCLDFNDALAEQSSPKKTQEAWDEFMKPQMANVYKAVAPYSLNNTILIWTSGGLDLANNDSAGVNGRSSASILCQLYNTSFDLSMQFNQGVHSIVPRSIQYLHPHTWDSSEAGLANVNENPGIGTAWVTHLLFRYFFIGNMSVGPSGTFITSNEANSMPLLQSGLIGCPEFSNSSSFFISMTNIGNCRNGTLTTAIEDLSRNFTYSTMAPDYLRGQYTTKVPINVSSPRNIYSYDMRNLLIAYVTSLLVVLLWMVVGGAALRSNGVTSSMSFSAIMLTTRNPDLDRLAEGHSLGIDPLPKHIGDMRMMFGCLDSEKSGKRGGFGFKGTVAPVQKGEILF